MSFSKKFLISFFLIFLLLPAFPCSSLSIPENELIFSLGGEVSVLNPILSTDTSSSAVEGAIFTGLTKVNEKLEIVPDLAESWNVSKDGKNWIFHLKKNVLWHDGHPFDAEDVKFTFDAILNPKVNSVRRSDYIIDGSPIEFKVLDKYTIEAVLPKPFAPFLSRSGMGVIPKHLLEGKDINSASFNRSPVGTGPFKFVRWKTGDQIVLAAFDSFYGGSPLLKSILFKNIPNENSALVALEAGEVDEASVPAKDFTRIRGKKGINVYEYDALVYTYLGFNLKKELFKKKEIRQALAYATNKKQLVGLILLNHGTPAFAPTAPASWSYSDDVEKFPYDPEKAKVLLAREGWKLDRQGRLNKNGKRFEFSVLLNQGNKEREKAAVILQQQYKKIGITMDIKVMEWAALLKIINAAKDPKDFDAVIIGWSLGLDPDSFSIWHSKEYPRGFNFIGYKNDEVDRLLQAGRTALDQAERKKIYRKLYRIISEEQPYIFLWYPKAISGISDRVGGLSMPGPAGMFLNLEKIYIKK